MFIFGNRNVSGDYLHQEDWDRLAQESDLQVVSAFSRDQVGTLTLTAKLMILEKEDKIYVQHRIVENGAKIWAMINDGAIVCLAGYSFEFVGSLIHDTAMPNECRLMCATHSKRSRVLTAGKVRKRHKTTGSNLSVKADFKRKRGPKSNTQVAKSRRLNCLQ